MDSQRREMYDAPMSKFTYVRLYADEDGESHLEDVSVDLELVDFAPPAPPVFVGGAQADTGVQFFQAPTGRDGKWHTSRKRQFMSILTGEFTGEVSDGEVRVFGTGSLLLLEDTTGKGHYTGTPNNSPNNSTLVTVLADQT